MTTDGKYMTLAVLKQYLQGTRTDPNNPTVFNGAVVGTPDDNLLTLCIEQAEIAFELATGSAFDQKTFTLVQPYQAFVDRNGWLVLYARDRGPVTAVTAVQVLNMTNGDTSFKTITWDTSNGIILPPFDAGDTHPHPESWKVIISPNPSMLPADRSELYARWSYTGGYAVAPDGLQSLIARMATYIYKLRDMPAGKVINQPLGTMMVPSDFPPDIRRQITLWSPVYG